jgi:hypothetical protein
MTENHTYTFYEIVCKDEDKNFIYIGSTKDFKNRKYQHKKTWNNENFKEYNIQLYQFIRGNGGWENFEMNPIEILECESKTHARIREQYWIELKKANLNKVRAYRTKEQAKKYNKEKTSEYREKNQDKIKDYIEKNKDKIKEYEREYREKNKEQQREYYEQNQDKIKEQKREYYLKKKDKIKEQQREYYEQNQDKIKEQKREYREQNKEKIKEQQREYYLKKKETE